MAYNNSIFPATYQPMGYQQMNYQQQPYNPPVQNQSTSGLIWVQGEAGAKSYLIAPNTTVQLWDSEDQVIYLKSADASGMPSMKILDYKIRDYNTPSVGQNVQQNTDIYVTKEELKAFQESLEKRFKSLTEWGVDNE